MDSKSALQELKQFESTRTSAGDYNKKYQTELGVDTAKQRADDIRGIIRGTEQALKGVGQSVAGRTRGNLVTEAQRARLEGLERQPLMEGIASQQGTYADESQTYRDLLGQSQQRAQMAYQTDADRLSSLQGRYDRLFQSEQAAEAKRQFEETLRLQREEAERTRAAAAASSRASFAPSLGGGGGGSRSTDQQLRDQAYGSVQQFLSQGRGVAESDYAATLRSANYGNQMDKYKIELYKQQGIGSGSSSGGKNNNSFILSGLSPLTGNGANGLSRNVLQGVRF